MKFSTKVKNILTLSAELCESGEEQLGVLFSALTIHEQLHAKSHELNEEYINGEEKTE